MTKEELEEIEKVYNEISQGSDTPSIVWWFCDDCDILYELHKGCDIPCEHFEKVFKK